ncbi:MAG: GMC family oxidoreductase N-terminal domain-containing protein, partial [Rhodospirillaceae bacterium]|nr:GMC family oxidoreductase N-terminal domain-containing protein [Rhodospirillaceae bacterium]
MEEYDYIIVGAGSAGCVLAERLSRDGEHRILILEAGGSDRRLWIKLPIGYGKTFYDERINWKYETEPDHAFNGRKGYWPRGKVLGGSSSINALVYCRGLPEDFDDWRDAGAQGWAWEDVRPHFEAIERHIAADGSVTGDGPLWITDVRERTHRVNRHFFNAAREIGFSQTDDFNAAQPEGVGHYRITTRNGIRCSAADAFLRPALRRANVSLISRVMVHRITFEGRRATGVDFRRDGQQVQIRARKEVISSAGSVNSPKLLQLSGVGPGSLLRNQGIEVVVDNPHVGG